MAQWTRAIKIGIIWVSAWRLKSPATQHDVKHFFKANIKENITILSYVNGVPITKSQYRRKPFCVLRARCTLQSHRKNETVTKQSNIIFSYKLKSLQSIRIFRGQGLSVRNPDTPAETLDTICILHRIIHNIRFPILNPSVGGVGTLYLGNVIVLHCNQNGTVTIISEIIKSLTIHCMGWGTVQNENPSGIYDINLINWQMGWIKSTSEGNFSCKGRANVVFFFTQSHFTTFQP